MESLGSAIIVFLVSSVAVIFAGVGLARFGDELAEKTGWGTLWVGTLLVSIATSLPELTINISAVWLEDSPRLALGNVFGANMINIFVIALVALIFGVRNLFENQGNDTKLLVLLGILLVGIALVVGATGDYALGPTSIGTLIIAAIYIAGMRAVYRAGRSDAEAAGDPQDPAPKQSALGAWIGFGLAAAVVIVAGRFLASSADSIAELTGIGASFIGVLLVSIVTTLPEGSVTIAAAMRKSYGIVMGNVYGSCAFNVFILFVAELFYSKGTLLGEMRSAIFVAGAAAMILMSLGYVIIRSCQTPSASWASRLVPTIPVVYISSLYMVYTLASE